MKVLTDSMYAFRAKMNTDATLVSRWRDDCRQGDRQRVLSALMEPSGQPGAGQVGAFKVRQFQIGFAEVGGGELRSRQMGAAQVGAMQGRGPDPSRRLAVGVQDLSRLEQGIVQIGPSQLGITEIGA